MSTQLHVHLEVFTYLCLYSSSSGGMQALEWALLGGNDGYVKSAVSIGMSVHGPAPLPLCSV